jgi:hypothetical protein
MATDLHFIAPKAGEELTGQIKAIQRMLGALIRNLPK